MLFMRLLLFFALLLIHTTTWAQTVTFVVDGDTFITDTGIKVRLLSINAPERANDTHPAEPFADTATEFLSNLVLNKPVRLKTVANETHDRYGRLLAHVYLEDGTWVNAELLKAGLAHLYTFPKTAHTAQPLFTAEAEAYTAKKGVWSLPHFQHHQADTPIADKFIGGYAVVKGTVKHTAKVQDTIYLNFGTDWRNDFTVSIPKKAWRTFEQRGIATPEQYYNNKQLIVRGFIAPVNGPMITATHPEQLQTTEQ